MDTKKIALPFKRSSHRQIVNANGNWILHVYSGGCSSNEEADAIEELVVRACNAHDDLVKALQEARTWFSENGPLAQKIDAALAAAKA